MPTIEDYYNEFFDQNFYEQSQHYEAAYRRLRDENRRLRARLELLEQGPLSKEDVEVRDDL